LPVADSFTIVGPTLSWTVQTSPVAPHIESATRIGNTVTLTFIAQAGQTYSLLGSDTLSPANWEKIADVSAQVTTGLVPVADSNATGVTRFYKLVTPQRP